VGLAIVVGILVLLIVLLKVITREKKPKGGRHDRTEIGEEKKS